VEQAPLRSIQAIWGGRIYGSAVSGSAQWSSDSDSVALLTSYLLTHLRGKNKREQLQYFARIQELCNQQPRNKVEIMNVCAAF
jgi:hypothetical protein